ncbi:MAG: hypothetical protein NVSMB9_29580 [Isosphaeraceae bacterium]
MVHRYLRAAAAAAFVTAFSWVSSVRACPLCDSETGERVRAGLFNAEFGYNLFVTLLPFPVFLAIVAVIHFGLPWAKHSPTTDHAPPGRGTNHP